MYSRRDFAKIAAGAIPLARNLWGVNSTIHGVRMGVQSASFTFSGIGIEGIIRTMVELGLAEIDVMSEHVENFLERRFRCRARGVPGRGRDALVLRAGRAPRRRRAGFHLPGQGGADPDAEAIRPSEKPYVSGAWMPISTIPRGWQALHGCRTAVLLLQPELQRLLYRR